MSPATRARPCVADTGVGIPAADLPHVFDRFHRSGTADDLATQGAGLGLTIVKAVVDAHGGTISVASSAGGERSGTVVSVVLPPGSTPPGSCR